MMQTAAGTPLSALALGTMTWSSNLYSTLEASQAEQAFFRALELQINTFDTADCYISSTSHGHSAEELLGQFMQRSAVPRDQLFLASKGGIILEEAGWGRRIDTTPDYLQRACHNSLKALQTSYIDLYYLHRVSRWQDTLPAAISTLAALKDAGYIRYIGLCELPSAAITYAHEALLAHSKGAYGLDAVQTEYSLLRRTPETDGVLDACRTHNIAFFAYSPLSRGFLSGKPQTFSQQDCRKDLPKYQGASLKQVEYLVTALKASSERIKCSLNTSAIQWIIYKEQQRGQQIIPILGTARPEHVLTPAPITETECALFQTFDHITAQNTGFGARYPNIDMEEFYLTN